MASAARGDLLRSGSSGKQAKPRARFADQDLSVQRQDLELALDERTFKPFVLTTLDGFALPVTDPHKALLGVSIIVITNVDGRLYQIPFGSIAHLSETGIELG
jgi:hypothetical protein